MALQAFPKRKPFALPNTLDPDGACSAFQRFRQARHAARVNLKAHGVLRLSRVFDKLNAAAPGTALLIGGHVDFVTCRKHTAHKLKIVTLVRNPIERSVSEYAYARAGFERKASLAKIDASLVAKAAGRYSYEGFLDYLLERRDVFGDLACRYLGWEPDATDISDHFAENVFHFGIVDDLSGFAAGLARKTGENVHVPHLNAGPQVLGSAVSARERRKLETLYANDFVLYDWCRAALRPKKTADQRSEPRHAFAAT